MKYVDPIFGEAPKIEAGDNALLNAMYRYTFGIIGDEPTNGSEAGGIGTGVGIYWRGVYLIVTAAHVMKDTDRKRLYFLLPDESLELKDSSIRSEATPPKLHKRYQLVDHQTIYAGNLDLAVFRLPEQQIEQGQLHFYHLDESHRTPSDAEIVGMLGYPAEAKLQVGLNYMATPSYSVGKIVGLPPGCDVNSQFAISYPTSENLNPPGFSGCGLWVPTKTPDDKVWVPQISLIGIVTKWYRQSEKLVGYRVEELIKFLLEKESFVLQ
jgi:hypothetical protein